MCVDCPSQNLSHKTQLSEPTMEARCGLLFWIEVDVDDEQRTIWIVRPLIRTTWLKQEAIAWKKGPDLPT